MTAFARLASAIGSAWTSWVARGATTEAMAFASPDLRKEAGLMPDFAARGWNPPLSAGR